MMRCGVLFARKLVLLTLGGSLLGLVLGQEGQDDITPQQRLDYG
jgi:hypothetical protein